MLTAILASRPPASSFRVARYASLSNVAFLCSHYERLDRPQDRDYTCSAVEIRKSSRLERLHLRRREHRTQAFLVYVKGAKQMRDAVHALVERRRSGGVGMTGRIPRIQDSLLVQGILRW